MINKETLYIYAILLVFLFPIYKGEQRVCANQLYNSRIDNVIHPYNKNAIVADTIAKDTIAIDISPNVNDLLLIFPTNNGTLLWKSHPLKVGIIKRSWPISTINEQGHLIGLNPDVMMAVLEKLNLNYQIYVGTLKEIERSFNNGDIDVVSGYLKIEKRISSCLFSMPYFYFDYRTAVLEKNKRLKETNDLNRYGASVAVGEEDDFTHEDFQNFAPNVTIKVYKNYREASESVYSGECDALLRMDCIPFIKDTISHQEMSLLPNVYYNAFPNTIAVRNGNKKLINLINNTLFKLIENGKINSIIKKYNLQKNKQLLIEAISRKMDILIVSALILFILLIYFLIKLMNKRKVNKETSNLFRNVLNKMPITLFLSEINNPFSIEYFNDVSHWLTVKNGKIEILPEFSESQTKKKLDEMIQNTWDTGESKMNILELKSKVTNKPFYVILRLMKISDGSKNRLIMTSIDGTDLISTKKLAELNDLYMTNYLVDVSFEIRTLLNSIVGFSQLIPDVMDSTTKDEYLDIIENKGQLLNILINDVLVLSKLESGQYIPTFQKINMIDYLEINHTQLFQKYLKPNIELILDSYYDTYFMDIDVDLYQIITEQLLRASIEFMDPGKFNIGFIEYNGEFILYASGNDNDYCKNNLLTILHQTLNSNYLGLNNLFSLAICLAAAKLLKAKVGFYHTKENRVTIWFSIQVIEENRSSITKKMESFTCKKELENRWHNVWFELDKNNEYQEGGQR